MELLTLPNARAGLFIDGANLYATQRQLQFDIDYRALRSYFAATVALVTANYYAALPDSGEYSPLKPLTDWLAYNCFNLVSKTAREFTDATGRRRIKGNMDVHLAVDAIKLAPHLDHYILFSGNSDFIPLIEALKDRGKIVTVVSSIKTLPPMCADELRRSATQFVELDELRTHFTRSSAKPPTLTDTGET